MKNADIHALMAAKGFTRKEDAPPLLVDNGIPSTASVSAQPAEVATSDVTKIGSLSASGLPVQRNQGLRAGTGGRLRKRQEALQKVLAQANQDNANSVADKVPSNL